jgi:hypothetical protein
MAPSYFDAIYASASMMLKLAFQQVHLPLLLETPSNAAIKTMLVFSLMCLIFLARSNPEIYVYQK